ARESARHHPSVSAKGALATHTLAATWRQLLLLAVIILCAGMLMSRLVFWQVMQHGHLAAQAAEEHAALYAQPAMRGRIFDAHMNPLATDVTMNLVYAVPRDIRNPTVAAAQLAPVLGQPSGRLAAIMASGSRHQILLAPRVDMEASQRLQQLAIHGIVLVPEIRRDYPEAQVASQVMGFVTNDNHGFYGIEGYYDGLLSGRISPSAFVKQMRGPHARIRSQGASPSHDGADLYLSLDGVVQGIAEDLLRKAVKQHAADGGTIIVMDPRTGHILGMANRPTFDPNHYSASDHSTYANPASNDIYEPGSTYKVITMAAGLDTHVVTPDTGFEDTGVFVVGTDVLHNWSGGGFGWETMTEVLQHSANVGAAWVAQRLGQDAFYRYVQRFGFGRPTGIEQQGEQGGLLPLPRDKSWSLVNLYTNAYGQGLAVTPLQLIQAVGAVANRGVLMQPQLVQRIVYGGNVIDRKPVPERRVMSRRAAWTLTHMLVQSAIGGEAQLGLVSGYNIAAKTGTANVAGPNGRYIRGDTIASIIGYAPAYHPRFVALVIIRHPRDTPWGSEAAAPVLHQLFQELFMYYHIPPSANATYR
ncbi:MAG: penicillin-binding protein 2, partial [Chloroflexi bacterium]